MSISFKPPDDQTITNGPMTHGIINIRRSG